MITPRFIKFPKLFQRTGTPQECIKVGSFRQLVAQGVRQMLNSFFRIDMARALAVDHADGQFKFSELVGVLALREECEIWPDGSCCPECLVSGLVITHELS